MNKIKKKYIKIGIAFLFVLLVALVCSFPTVRARIPLYASQEVVDWVDLVIIPIVLAIATGGLITVWFNYKSEKERMIDGLRRELDCMKMYNYKKIFEIADMYLNSVMSNQMKKAQIMTMLKYVADDYFLQQEYPELCEYVRSKHVELINAANVENSNAFGVFYSEIVKKSNEIDEKISATDMVFRKTYYIQKEETEQEG